MQHPKVIYCGDRPRRCAEEKHETPTGDTVVALVFVGCSEEAFRNVR